MEKSETAKNTMQTWQEIKVFVREVCEDVDKEAGSISSDQKLYADYLCGVKDFKPWMEATEAKIKEALPKPDSLETALTLLEACKVRTVTVHVSVQYVEFIVPRNRTKQRYSLYFLYKVSKECSCENVRRQACKASCLPHSLTEKLFRKVRERGEYFFGLFVR